MFASFIIWNPIVLAILYPIEYNIGDKVLKNAPAFNLKIEILNNLIVYTGKFLLGSLILALSISITSYTIIYVIAKINDKKIRNI